MEASFHTGKRVAFFDDLTKNKITACWASDPQSMIPAYHHVLTSMPRRD